MAVAVSIRGCCGCSFEAASPNRFRERSISHLSYYPARFLSVCSDTVQIYVRVLFVSGINCDLRQFFMMWQLLEGTPQQSQIEWIELWFWLSRFNNQYREISTMVSMWWHVSLFARGSDIVALSPVETMLLLVVSRFTQTIANGCFHFYRCSELFRLLQWKETQLQVLARRSLSCLQGSKGQQR